jgi:hypothetical protein
VLLNLAKDPAVEAKMVAKRIVAQVAATLSHRNPDPCYLQHLHLLAVAFLKKLSLRRQNVTDMHALGVPAAVLTLVHTHTSDGPAPVSECASMIVNACLRLAYNLSFHSLARPVLLRALPLLARCLHRPACAQTATRVLYSLSTDPAAKPHVDLALRPHAALVARALVDAPGRVADQELAALAINMAANPVLARLMALPDGAALLAHRAIRHQDLLLLRLVRALAALPAVSPQLVPSLQALAGLVTHASNPELRIEALGVLASVEEHGVRFAALLQSHPLAEFLLQNLAPAHADDDILLQAVLLLGALALDPRAATLLAVPALVTRVSDTLGHALQAGDADLTLQTVFAVFRLLHHAAPRSLIAQHPVLCARVADACAAAGQGTRHYASCCVDILMEFAQPAQREELVRARFEAHNAEYMRFLSEGGVAHLLEEGLDGEDADEYGGYGYDDYEEEEEEELRQEQVRALR